MSVGANEEAERSHAAADRVHLGLPTQGPDVVNVGRHQSLIIPAASQRPRWPTYPRLRRQRGSSSVVDHASGQPASTLAYLLVGAAVFNALESAFEETERAQLEAEELEP